MYMIYMQVHDEMLNPKTKNIVLHASKVYFCSTHVIHLIHHTHATYMYMAQLAMYKVTKKSLGSQLPRLIFTTKK